MSFIHDPYYDDTPIHNKIKPKQLIKIPYDFPEHGLAPIDEYIRLSPALDYLMNVGCLVVMTFHSNTLFYCDCSIHLEKAEQMWSESIRYFPLVLFEDHMKKLSREKTAPVKKAQSKLKTLLDELHQDEKPSEPHDDENNSNPPFENLKPQSDKQRAIDILDLIRKRQNKKK